VASGAKEFTLLSFGRPRQNYIWCGRRAITNIQI